MPIKLLLASLALAALTACAPMVGGAIVVGADAALENERGGDGLF